MPVYTTLQPMFNKIWGEFVVNKRPRAVAGIACIYRGDGEADSDTRCAIGVCIPDEMYDPKLDDCGSIGEIHREMPDWYASVFNGLPIDALNGLQLIHDEEFENFEEEMRDFAYEHSLYIPSLDDEMPIPGVGIDDL